VEVIVLEKYIKNNPENLIRELLTSKYGTLDNACKELELGSRQALNNNLKRWSKQEGTFKAFYNILSQLQYRVEYSAIPILSREFNYEEFSKLLDNGEIKRASALINREYNGENLSLNTTEYTELRNQLENRKSLVENKYRTVVTFSKEHLKSIIDLHNSPEFSKNLEFIINGYFKIRDIYEDILKAIDSSNIVGKEDIKKEFMKGYFKTIDRTKQHYVKKVMVDQEEVWVKLENNKIYEITDFFENNSLLKFKVKKNREKLEISYLNIIGNDIYIVSGNYDGVSFLGEYNPIIDERNKVKF